MVINKLAVIWHVMAFRLRDYSRVKTKSVVTCIFLYALPVFNTDSVKPIKGG